MALRSILFVPGDSEKKLARAADAGADALVLDLEDSVAPARKDAARTLVSERLGARGVGDILWVRINPEDSGEMAQDLALIVPRAPDAIMVPKVSGPADIARLDTLVSEHEERAGLARGHIKVVPVATETGASIFGIGGFDPRTPRLLGLTWGAEDLAAAVGAQSNRNEQGELTSLYRLARDLCLAASAKAECIAIDTASISIADLDAVKRECAVARRDGFTAKLAIHPAQVPIINDTFAVTPAELAQARAVVEAFDADPELGTIQLDGRMIDIPHLKQARRILGQAGAA